MMINPYKDFDIYFTVTESLKSQRFSWYNPGSSNKHTLLQLSSLYHLNLCRFSAPLKKFYSIQMQHWDKNAITWMTESVISKHFTLLIQISLCNPEISLNPELFGDGLLSKTKQQKWLSLVVRSLQVILKSTVIFLFFISKVSWCNFSPFFNFCHK